MKLYPTFCLRIRNVEAVLCEVREKKDVVIVSSVIGIREMFKSDYYCTLQILKLTKLSENGKLRTNIAIAS